RRAPHCVSGRSHARVSRVPPSTLHFSLLPSCLCIPPATPDFFTLSLHDALPICLGELRADVELRRLAVGGGGGGALVLVHDRRRSEEHTSELQSRFDLVCRLLLEKKKERRTHVTAQRAAHMERCD